MNDLSHTPGAPLSRRGFLKFGGAGLTAASLAGCRLWALEEGLPGYYGDHVARVMARVGRLAERCADGFWFITDLHIPRNRRMSGRILAKLVSETCIDKVLCGGDMPEAFGGRESVDRTIREYCEQWVDAVERAGGEFYPAKGNHDFTIRAAMDTQEGFTYPGEFTRRVLMRTKAVRHRAVVCDADPEAFCYYVDFPERRMRYIVADTTDRTVANRAWWAVDYGIGDAQLSWLAGTALMTVPDGWGVVVMHHVPVAGVAARNGEKRTYAAWRGILEAYQGRRIADACGRTFDFTAAKGAIVLDITGHHHAELQSQVNGIWHVTNPCDAAYSDYIDRSTPWCPNLPKKERGTVFEQTFDAVQIDMERRMIHFTRVGGGGDRALHVKRRRVRVGEGAAFEAKEFAGPVKWGCFDADRCDFVKFDPARPYAVRAVYFNDVAEISQDGVLTAKKPGESVVLALSPNGDKEMFPVVVA